MQVYLFSLVISGLTSGAGAFNTFVVCIFLYIFLLSECVCFLMFVCSLFHYVRRVIKILWFLRGSSGLTFSSFLGVWVYLCV